MNQVYLVVFEKKNVFEKRYVSEAKTFVGVSGQLVLEQKEVNKVVFQSSTPAQTENFQLRTWWKKSRQQLWITNSLKIGLCQN